MSITTIDEQIIATLKKISGPLARLSLFVIFFWFGILKVLGTSPANQMVESLQQKTLPFLSFSTFIILFGIYEMIIGLLFIIPRLERVAIAILIPHIIMTSLPLIFLPGMTWEGFLVPTMEVQYIIKNLVIVALALAT
ncbi:MAG TPA: hypothetical protein VJA27_02480, partial [Patescibacteria group bacterium]|nr:hypothetical protein [Patescibacteria group bacterium]